MTALPAFSQTPTAASQICTPRVQAAKNADSLRALPVVRRQYAAARTEAAALGRQLVLSQTRVGQLDARSQELNGALVAQLQATTLWKVKARRRGWVIGIGVGLPAAIGAYTLLR
ncbi:hypothetical protein [Solirubrum puertoriconensis]|uniref:Uncharacterized protein n=1 Tax=Solirubrum puertoriconensis TaxID=1751427 RepID=A0A9X0HJE4_SOLP1|nr:hypothetical protein [Solirubrum puertoriconensis]KUG06873.1 hypothetical protein ASU33_05990 [Solirubrum puertoriconensis]